MPRAGGPSKPKVMGLATLGGELGWPREAGLRPEGLASTELDGPRMSGPNGPRAGGLDKPNN